MESPRQPTSENDNVEDLSTNRRNDMDANQPSTSSDGDNKRTDDDTNSKKRRHKKDDLKEENEKKKSKVIPTQTVSPILRDTATTNDRRNNSDVREINSHPMLHRLLNRTDQRNGIDHSDTVADFDNAQQIYARSQEHFENTGQANAGERSNNSNVGQANAGERNNNSNVRTNTNGGNNENWIRVTSNDRNQPNYHNAQGFDTTPNGPMGNNPSENAVENNGSNNMTFEENPPELNTSHILDRISRIFSRGGSNQNSFEGHHQQYIISGRRTYSYPSNCIYDSTGQQLPGPSREGYTQRPYGCNCRVMQRYSLPNANQFMLNFENPPRTPNIMNINQRVIFSSGARIGLNNKPQWEQDIRNCIHDMNNNSERYVRYVTSGSADRARNQPQNDAANYIQSQIKEAVWAQFSRIHAELVRGKFDIFYNSGNFDYLFNTEDLNQSVELACVTMLQHYIQRYAPHLFHGHRQQDRRGNQQGGSNQRSVPRQHPGPANNNPGMDPHNNVPMEIRLLAETVENSPMADAMLDELEDTMVQEDTTDDEEADDNSETLDLSTSNNRYGRDS